MLVGSVRLSHFQVEKKYAPKRATTVFIAALILLCVRLLFDRAKIWEHIS